MTPHPACSITSALALTLALGGLLPQAARADCPPLCVSTASVVNAAGVPEFQRLARIAERIEFNGSALAPTGNRTIKELAAELKRLPTGSSFNLRVGADNGLAGPAAASQAKARQQTLQKALAREGVKAGQVTVAVAT